MIGSWLSGPQAALPKGELGTENKYRGERLGLPETGPGSLPGPGRRMAAMFVDILLAAGVAAVFTAPEAPRNWSLLVWFVVAIFAVAAFSFTPGQQLLGLRVQRVDKPVNVGLLRSLGRAVMVFFLIPAAVWDKDGRGLHDRLTNTIVVRTR
jgi:uncharacterized RDD family membrane protein YckC